MGYVTSWKNIFGDFFDGSRISDQRHVNTTERAMSSTDIFISNWFGRSPEQVIIMIIATRWSDHIQENKQRVLMHGHQGWNVRHGLCHIYMRYVYIYIYIWVVYSLCFFCCLFITVTWWYVWCIEWASGNQEEVQACLVTLWLFNISCYSLYKTTLGLLCSWFENNPHFHKYSMDFHV